jgi:hypothetical protein
MMISGRLGRAAALMVGAVAYFIRPWSCSLALERFSPQDQVPYANFDSHGFVAMSGWLLAFAFSPLIFWLAWRVTAVAVSKEESHAAPLQTRVALGSLLVALAIGAPTFTQITYLAGLPVAVAEPVIVSAFAWAALVAAFWVMFVRRKDAQHVAEAIKGRALLLAALIAVPKILIVGSSLFGAS